uniref:Tf2-1-like SH3-like domain-containing protein n=1 Tax=Peronospora matthiolae TaxID=2874970 RepID=A0AAV1TIZ6_9STRA
MDADVDGINIDDDDDGDVGIFSIANDFQSENDDTLTGKNNALLALPTKRTAVDKDESAEEFLLTREAVVLFVQVSVADAQAKQKRNSKKLGRAKIRSLRKDLVLLSTVNLPKYAVTNVGSSKLLPEYIDPYRVLRRMGNTYTIELSHKMRTHPTFYVSPLCPYYQKEPVSRCKEHLHGREPRLPSSDPVSTSQSGWFGLDLRSDLFTQFSDFSTSYSKLITKRTSRTFVLKLRKRKRGTIVLTIVR